LYLPFTYKQVSVQQFALTVVDAVRHWLWLLRREVSLGVSVVVVGMASMVVVPIRTFRQCSREWGVGVST
jgi:hypothetical protein